MRLYALIFSLLFASPSFAGGDEIIITDEVMRSHTPQEILSRLIIEVKDRKETLKRVEWDDPRQEEEDIDFFPLIQALDLAPNIEKITFRNVDSKSAIALGLLDRQRNPSGFAGTFGGLNGSYNRDKLRICHSRNGDLQVHSALSLIEQYLEQTGEVTEGSLAFDTKKRHDVIDSFLKRCHDGHIYLLSNPLFERLLTESATPPAKKTKTTDIIETDASIFLSKALEWRKEALSQEQVQTIAAKVKEMKDSLKTCNVRTICKSDKSDLYPILMELEKCPNLGEIEANQVNRKTALALSTLKIIADGPVSIGGIIETYPLTTLRLRLVYDGYNYSIMCDVAERCLCKYLGLENPFKYHTKEFADRLVANSDAMDAFLERCRKKEVFLLSDPKFEALLEKG